MAWFNVFGLAFMVVIMIPNVIFAMKYKEGFENKWNHKTVEFIEQIGRFGCFGFMVIYIPGTWLGWCSEAAFAVYLVIDTLLAVLYCAIWVVCWKKTMCSGHWHFHLFRQCCSFLAAL